MGKLENNKQQKRTSLLDTAFKLFTTQGVSKTSIAEISQKAGIAKGTFYLYFKDKYDIRNKLVSHEASKLCKRLLVHMIRPMYLIEIAALLPAYWWEFVPELMS